MVLFSALDSPRPIKYFVPQKETTLLMLNDSRYTRTIVTCPDFLTPTNLVWHLRGWLSRSKTYKTTSYLELQLVAVKGAVDTANRLHRQNVGFS